MNLHTRSFLRMIRKDWEIYSLQFITLSVAFATAIVIVSFASNELNGGSGFYDRVKYGEPYAVLILACISGLIILLATTNFINLVSLTLPARAKELAMRKVAGANKTPLLVLLAKESVAVTLISLTIAIALLLICIEPAKKYLSIDLVEWINHNTVGSYAILISIFAAITIGPLLPAWTFVKSTPGRLLSTDTITFPRMKKVITVVQLGISISLIVASLVIDRQISRSLIREPGKNHDQVVYVRWPRDMTRASYLRMKDEWPQFNPHIVKITAVSQTPDNLTSKIVGDDRFRLNVEFDFKDFFEVEMVAGNWFGPNDRERTIVTKGTTTKDTTSVGVIGNFFAPNHVAEVPLRITVDKDDYNYILIRVLEVDIRNSLFRIGEVFEDRSSGRAPTVAFLDKNYEKIVAYEDQLNKLSSFLAIVSFVMAICAIYALSLSRMKDNLKQIAIRKTFGASNLHIVRKLSTQFLELMLASVFFFGPLTYWLLREWLRNFAYSAKFNWSDPLISIAVCLVIVGITNLLLLGRLNSSALRELLRR